MDVDDPKELVRRGYDALSVRYDEAYGGGTKYASWIAELTAGLPARARVLDLGCGSGVPVARALAVTGVDISEVQIRRARAAVPGAEFVPEGAGGAALFRCRRPLPPGDATAR